MARVLPVSLSPHVCILPSPDLTGLLAASSLPPLEQILQSFSPLPQVTTRTTSLASVSHASFALRFSNLADIEEGCREEEEQRAVRTIDWIGARINHRCSRWVSEFEKLGQKEPTRTPWWDELKRCAEGDHVPSKSEGWNHPLSIILAVSTMAPNPLQAIAALHARTLEFPPWVDRSILTYTLIVHPKNSSLSDEEAGALFNAVKKQYGLHSYMLPLVLPSPPPPPVPVPALSPRLPPAPSDDSPQMPYVTPATPNFPDAGSSTPIANPLNTLRMGEQDIQQTARFTREFVVMSLVPWMERRVVEWNENFSSTRRLPSRLFSTTRRLFGSPSPSPAPTPINPSVRSHGATSSVSSLNSLNGSIALSSHLPQHRRLAEFATILGDDKLAMSVWESLRKEGKGGSDILPLLLAPSPAVPLHVANALSSINPSGFDASARAQLVALMYAVRWELGVGKPDFLDEVMEGERWLVWAAGNGDEPPSALLLAQAALLSSRKHAYRRAALWYLTAASRLEKCGIKPLTMYFLRQAHQLYQQSPPKQLSPLFWDSEGRSPSDIEGFDAIMSAIEHPLGRLLYTTGDVAGAVRYFLGLFRNASSSNKQTSLQANGNWSPPNVPGVDKVFLDDFRVAFAHFKTTAGDIELADFKLPFTFCQREQTRVRLPRDNSTGDPETWAEREETWKAFWKTSGPELLAPSGKAAVDETFWIDLVLRNPLDAEVNLSNLSVTIQEDGTSKEPASSNNFVTVEAIEDIILTAKETRSISVSVKSSRPTTLLITNLTYDFLSLLPCVESLATRGRRLHATALQRQIPTYGPDVNVRVNIAEASHKLLVNFVDDRRLVMAQGECKRMQLWLSNTGTEPIAECWLLVGPEDELWIDGEDSIDSESDIIQSNNSIRPVGPHRIQLPGSLSVLDPGDNLDFPVLLHAEQLLEQDLCLLFVYREDQGTVFHSVRVTRHYEVRPILDISVSASPCQDSEHMFLLDCEIGNVSSSNVVQVTHITAISPTWKCSPTLDRTMEPLAPLQLSRFVVGVSSWNEHQGTQETSQFVRGKLRNVIQGITVEPSHPPPMHVLCNHLFKASDVHARTREPATRHFIHCGRRKFVSRHIATTHPHIPPHSHSSIFPLFHPASVDLIVFWEIPGQHRSGHLLISGMKLGAEHAPLKEIIEEGEGAKVKRSMYAETQREKIEVLDAIRNSEWNMEMDPIVVTLKRVDSVDHDFSKGPYHIPVAFTLRNYSRTHTSRFTLRFTTNTASEAMSSELPCPFSGRLTFTGVLQPLGTTAVQTAAWVQRPGTYSVSTGWELETEVGEPSSARWSVRHRYSRRASADGSCITVSHSSLQMS